MYNVQDIYKYLEYCVLGSSVIQVSSPLAAFCSTAITPNGFLAIIWNLRHTHHGSVQIVIDKHLII